MTDEEILALIQDETARQAQNIQMIPSENHTSEAVLAALGTRLSDKYAEGYPGRRYYGGCEVVDKVEDLARERAKTLFGVSHANVQPYSGSPANLAAMLAVLDPGDTIMGLSLPFGGHLTHGHTVSATGQYYKSAPYQTGKDGFLDYDAIAELAAKEKPKLIIAGATAYPREYDWKKFRQIADSVDAWLLADISHISGLIAGGVHPSPAGIADIISTTTHKTLRGPRGAMLLCNGEPSNPSKKPERTRNNLPSLIDRAVFPGLQGGPHINTIAGIAVALKEATEAEFKTYAKQIVANSRRLASQLSDRGFELVTGGSDNHLLLIDMTSKAISGAEAETVLDTVGITVNKNSVPFDARSPFDPSGIRMGTPAITTRGMKEPEMDIIAEIIDQAIESRSDQKKLNALSNQIKELAARHSLPS